MAVFARGGDEKKVKLHLQKGKEFKKNKTSYPMMEIEFNGNNLQVPNKSSTMLNTKHPLNHSPCKSPGGIVAEVGAFDCLKLT